IPLFICGEAGETNTFNVTDNFGDVSAFFNNGILSTQNLRKQLETAVGKAPTKADLDPHIKKAGDPLRTFLSGDVLPALKSMFDRAKQSDGTLHLALYELEDRELIDLLAANQARLNLILSTAGSGPEPTKKAKAMAAAAKSMVKRSAKKAKKKTAAKKTKKASAAKKVAKKKAKKFGKKGAKSAGKRTAKDASDTWTERRM